MRKSFVSVVLVLGLFLISIPALRAQTTDILKNYRVEMPKVELLSKEEQAASMTLYEDTPFNDKKLAYKILVPNGWKNQLKSDSKEEALSNRVLGELARFYGPPKVTSERSFLNIQAINLEYEMSAEHWVLRYLLSRGLTPKGLKKIDRTRVEFFFVNVEGDTTYGIHSVAQINGKRVLMAQYHLPLESWEEEKKLQATVIESLAAANPIEEDVELMVEYRFLDVAKVKYPESWKLKAPAIRSIDKMKIQVLNFNQNATEYKPTLDGQIEAYLNSYFAVESMEEEKKVLIDALAKSNLKLDGEIESEEDRLDNYFKNHEDFDSYDLEVYKVTSTKNKLLGYEYWITSLESGDYFYFFTLLTPSRNDDFFIWSRNKETYDLIIKSFEPYLEGLVYEE